MPRNPFVWEVQVRREIVDEEMARLRDIPYTLWREVMKAPAVKIVKGRDERPYRLKVTAEYVHTDSEDIRVTLSLARAGVIRRGLIRQTFIITPTDSVRV